MPSDFSQRLNQVLSARPPKQVRVAGARDAAVLVPVLAAPEPTLLFTLRTDTVKSHKGQISFPGGSIDAGDASPRAAALREAREEIALDPAAVTVLGELDPMPTFVTGFVVHPVVGWIEREPHLAPNPAEVAEILRVPVASFTEDIRVPPGRRVGDRTYPTEAWSWRGFVIWGFTARVLRVFFARLAEAGLAEPLEAQDDWPGIPEEFRI